MQLLFVMHLW